MKYSPTSTQAAHFSFKKRARFSLAIGASFFANCLICQADSVIAGTDPPVQLQEADGWSGLVVLTTEIAPPGDGTTVGRVTTFNYYVDDARSLTVLNSEHVVTPVLLEFDGTDYVVIGVGTDDVPIATGLQSVPFGLVGGTNVIDTSNVTFTYHVGLVQQRNGANDDDAAGVVSFSFSDGPGMIQENILGPGFVVTPGHRVTATFSSPAGVGGRSYAFNFEVDFTPLGDSDMDGMPDTYEDANEGLDKTDGTDGDDDEDGDMLTNLMEFMRFTDPNKKDTDEDGLDDNIESNSGVWVAVDTDTGTNPLRKDTDGDGYDDNFETNTGIWVGLEMGLEDTGTNPLEPDTDGDGLRDGLESNTGIFVGRNTDTGTSPLDKDSDDDGSEDGTEITSGFDPTDPDDTPDGRIAGQQPLEQGGTVDEWTHFLYLDESRVLALNGETGLVTARFKFEAVDEAGRVTPVLAEATAPNEFIIRAIGTTRIGGIDWTGFGPQDFAFSDTGEVMVQDGWIAGIATYDPVNPNPAEGGSPIAFFGGSGIDGWMTGSFDGVDPPILEVGQAPGLGATDTSTDGFGGRDYAFHITVAEPVAPLEISSIILSDGTEEVTLVWSSALDENYRIRYSSSLEDISNNLGNVIPAEGVIPSGGETTNFLFSNPSPTAQKLFFRVERMP